MKKHIATLTIICWMASSQLIFSQIDTIFLKNPSFEDTPKRGTNEFWSGIKNWTDCAPIHGFRGETPPDIHPNGWWENDLPASDGKTYLGMVTRDNDTYESVSQRLDEELKAGKCYTFVINLARAPRYISLTRTTGVEANYNTPVVLRIWGGSTLCQEMELLGESAPVSNSSWQIFNFDFKPKSNIRYITFSAFYKTPTLFPYNGNLLIDGGSAIIQEACPGETPLLASNSRTQAKKLPPHKQKQSSSTKSQQQESKPKEPVAEKKPKIMTELSRTDLKEGQTIEIKNLYFSEDSSSVSLNSFEVLDEVYNFLLYNKNIIVEIGGHTNNIPSHEYCDKLSTLRAKAVAEYLVRKGIAPEKIQFKGYGKRQPIADNKTPTGRKRNQRVEIKILSIKG
jgi:outer membrane protein OmpA-like peptidoglycan-associated protein